MTFASTPCRGDVCRADVLDRTGFRTASCSRRRCHRRSSNTSSLRHCRHRSSNTSSLRRCRHRNASRDRTRSDPANWFRPGTSSSATSRAGLASVIERAVSQWGLPNGYVLGEEGSGAFVAGLRYGEGTLYTKNAGDLRVYWQGPSVGFDWGGDGARTMTLVYNLPATSAIYQRFVGIDGSAYIVGGFGMTALTANNIVLVPIRSGIGLRLGANVGYLKFTRARPGTRSELLRQSDIRTHAVIVPARRFRLTRQWAGVCPAGRGNVINKSLIWCGVTIHDRTDHVSGDRFSGLDAVRSDDRAAGAQPRGAADDPAARGGDTAVDG